MTAVLLLLLLLGHDCPDDVYEPVRPRPPAVIVA